MSDNFNTLQIIVEPPPVEVRVAASMVRCGETFLTVTETAPGSNEWEINRWGSIMAGPFAEHQAAIDFARKKAFAEEKARLARIELDRVLAEGEKGV